MLYHQARRCIHCFFFSSRRRHTRLQGDWSSDVCSSDLALAFPRLKQFFASHRDITAIATCRRAVNGGHFRGSVASQYELLIKAAQNGFRLLDVELETAAQLKPHEFEKLRNVAALILSFHYFKGTQKL